MEWKPIESAPKDGSEILIFVNGQIVVAAWRPVWHPSNLKWVHKIPEAIPGEANRGSVDFGPDYDTDGKISAWSRPGPTHWMPLPTPPNEGTSHDAE